MKYSNIRTRAFKIIILSSFLAISPLTNATTSSTESGSVSRGSWQNYGPYSAAAGDFTVVMTGSDDADLYVNEGSRPDYNRYDCRPYAYGSNESCSLQGAGEFYIAVYGYNTSNYQLTISYEEVATANIDPVVSISSSSSSYDEGATVTMTATANDAEDGDLSGSIQWFSNIDGDLSIIGATLSISTLSVGSHTITATVADSSGASVSVTESITINEVVVGNTDPTISIASTGTSYVEGALVTITATANDAEDGNLSGSV
jgi:hypothetical protein